MARSSTVFPAPEGPSTPSRSPKPIATLTPRISQPPDFLSRRPISVASIAWVMGVDGGRGR